MATNNRANLINQAIKVVKKQFKPVAVPKDRTLLEHLLFACCLENSTYECAERVFRTLVTDYFDWNEVRVSTIRELSEVMKPLNDPEESATRLKRVLQAVFETHYSFDLEPLKKQNIGQAVKQLDAYNGSTPFAIAFVTQHALGGHSIPISQGLLESMRVVGVVSDAEAAKGAVPGLDRAVPKTKGAEVASLLHQLGVEMSRSPLGPTIRKLLLEINPDCKDHLPKRHPTKAADSGESAVEAAPTPTAEVASAPPRPPVTEEKPKKKKAASLPTEPLPAAPAKSEAKAEAKAKAKPEPKPAAKAEPKTEIKAEAKSGAKAEGKGPKAVPGKKPLKKVPVKKLPKRPEGAEKSAAPQKKKKAQQPAKPITRRKPR